MTLTALIDMPWVDAEVARVGRLFSDGRLAHALLVGGPSGLGKRAFAEKLAQRILCRDPQDGRACGKCRDCRQLRVGSHADFRRISFEERKDGKLRTELTVAQIRRLGDSLNLTAQHGAAVVAVLDPADAMNANAANALLKTLEEPQPGRFLMLIADHPERLAITLRSRCQRIAPKPPSREVALAWLATQGHEGDVASAALALADGLPRRALSYIEDDVITLQKAVRRDLGNAATGKQAPFALAREWMADRPALRLELAVELVRELGRKKLAVAQVPSGLTARVDFPKLAAWADRANRARGLFGTTIRHELLIGELLLDWREAFSAAVA